ncbi:MAG: Asp-tRNA(Asn)/Glu-tRNA(Gln) amidotransferase subunit GatB [Promethearchaeota archaeon]
MGSSQDLEVMIGLEVHIQLNKLKTKMFCGCSSDYRGKPPNSVTCEVCLALPGTLPVLNKRAVEFALRLAEALGAEIQQDTFFFRKNYYYPDMAKNFQISQYDKAGGVPIAVGGEISFFVGKEKRVVHLSRLHLEEDPGRLTYKGSIATSPYALVDYNRHGSTLVECVTKPEIHSPEEARFFLKKLRSIVEHLDIADLSLEGSMRCDANISFRGYQRVEVKNISSLKEVERALKFEMKRQRQKINMGKKIVMETRHWDEDRRVTISLRTKETEMDYRYFPEPDLVPIHVTDAMISDVRAKLPELPDARVDRFIREYGIPKYDAEVIIGSKAMADFYEECTRMYHKPKIVANWLMGDVSRRLNELNCDIMETKVTPENLVEMLKMIDDGTITGKIGKKLIKGLIEGKKASKLVDELGLRKIGDPAVLERIATEVIEENQKVVTTVKEGKNPKAFEFLVGQVMRKTRGQADPVLTRKILKEKIG